MSMRWLLGLGCCLPLLLVSVADPQAGEEGYHAANCHAADGASAAVLAFNEGTAYNTSTTDTATLVCPIHHTYVHPGSGGYMLADLRVVDRHPTQDIECTLYWRNVDGSPNWSWTYYSTGASSSFQIMGYVNDEDFYYGKMWRCTLPPRYQGLSSKVVYYHVAHADP